MQRILEKSVKNRGKKGIQRKWELKYKSLWIQVNYWHTLLIKIEIRKHYMHPQYFITLGLRFK